MSLQDAIVRVCKDTHLPMVDAVFGKEGVEAAFLLMQAAQALYKHIEPERVKGRLIIFKTVHGHDRALSDFIGPIADLASLANQTITDLTIEVDPEGILYLRASVNATPEEIATTAVVYYWHAGREEFLAGNERKPVIRLDPVARSQFAVPTFGSLREALQRYAVENIRESTCYLFNKAWSDEKNRIFLKAGPEEIMRNSLTQFLRNRLGADHDVWPEQNVDESHPVDIQVRPRFTSNRVMLIEIKWLGWSVREDGHVTAKYGQPRAQTGADQLAQYLEDKRKFAPTSVIHGYYVIIDCRRKNLHEGITSLSVADGLHYENGDLEFDPAHHTERNDFDPPYRMFARPVWVG